ncbi:Uncharacterised protein [Candidatus Tiddalikarchaeum anstoanum]|nr:Uncharacterised protein [Candidatus Tiddalikarchaeum anstoanum]
MSFNELTVKDLILFLRETGFSFLNNEKGSFFFADGKDYCSKSDSRFESIINNLIKHCEFEKKDDAATKSTNYGTTIAQCVVIDTNVERDPCMMYSYWNPPPKTYKFRLEIYFPKNMPATEVKTTLIKSGYLDLVAEEKKKDNEFINKLKEFRKNNP